MKLMKILFGLLLLIPFLWACQDDVSELDDPRDLIIKVWDASDDYDAAGASTYDVEISKDANEKTRIIMDNFHSLGFGTKVYATMAGTNLTIPEQVIDATYTISGSGLITDNYGRIDFTYSYEEGNDGAVDVTATFYPKVDVKKKSIKPTL